MCRISFYARPPYSQDRTPDKPSILDLDWKGLVEQWPVLVGGVKLAVEFLEQERVFDSSRLPIVTPVPALIALWAKSAELSPDRVGAVRTALRAYLWRSFFTERYESSAHTQVIRDVRALAEALPSGDLMGGDIYALPLPGKDDVLSAGWPKKRDRLARAILAVSLYGGALDLADGSQAVASNLPQREYHHLFPEGYLRRELSDTQPNLALNCALITWKTNRKISDKNPLAYLKERTLASSLGDAEIADRLQTHTLPVEPLMADDYDTFLDERATLMLEAMKTLSQGRPWRP